MSIIADTKKKKYMIQPVINLNQNIISITRIHLFIFITVASSFQVT